MKAIVHDRYRRAEDVLQLREMTHRVAGDGEVLVRVHAAAVAIGDWLITNGLPHIARPGCGLLNPKNHVARLEVAGHVEATNSTNRSERPASAIGRA